MYDTIVFPIKFCIQFKKRLRSTTAVVTLFCSFLFFPSELIRFIHSFILYPLL